MLHVLDTPQSRKGRAACSNTAGRFESSITFAIDNDWEQQANSIRKTSWTLDSTRSAISRYKSPDIPFNRPISPYQGCEHGCVYCYACPGHTDQDYSAGLDFEAELYLKKQTAELFQRELLQPSYRCTPIALGVNTDAYQPLEKDLKITRKILEAAVQNSHPVILMSKSSLIERDMDLLQQLAANNLVSISISLSSLDPKLSAQLEPRASSPERRLRTMEKLNNAGIPTRLSLSPVIPGLNENALEPIVQEASNAGARHANYHLLRLPLEVEQRFSEWLYLYYPLRAKRILNAIADCRTELTSPLSKNNNARFAHRMRGSGPRAALILQRFKHACNKSNIEYSATQPNLNCNSFIKPSD